MPTPLLATRVHIPPLFPTLIFKPRMIDRKGANLQTRDLLPGVLMRFAFPLKLAGFSVYAHSIECRLR